MADFEADNLVNESIAEYLDDFIGRSPEPARTMENYADQNDFPIVGPVVGRLLKLIASAVAPTRIVELGSGFGYSAFWFGEGAPEATIDLTDLDDDNLDRAKQYLSEASNPDRFRYHRRNGVKFLSEDSAPVDLIFIDIDKKEYPEALKIIGDRLRPGGWLVADNVLWKGKVVGSLSDEATRSIGEFNEKLSNSSWDSVILPVRDGVALAQRTSG